jgi:hypothetical protein
MSSTKQPRSSTTTGDRRLRGSVARGTYPHEAPEDERLNWLAERLEYLAAKKPTPAIEVSRKLTARRIELILLALDAGEAKPGAD